MKGIPSLIVAGFLCSLACLNSVHGATLTFFNASQTATNVASGATSGTIRCGAYLLTYTLDKWWYPAISIGPGTPTGRPVSMTWPTGVQAQTLTAGPSGTLPAQTAATIIIKRADGTPFDLKSFTGKILGNTAGAGASFEIMPSLNSVDGFVDPLMFDATGYGGSSFSYSTPTLTGFDAYNISLWMDYALTALTLVDADPVGPPALLVSMSSSNQVRIAWSMDATGFTLQSSPDAVPGHFTDTGAAPATEGI
jgi:hypothetical protein